jgi:RNA polymerase sigma factor (sigma-70 family)
MEKPSATSDAALVVAVARGSEPALEEIYRRHADALYSLGRRVTRNDAMAAEIVQEIFVRLWATPERFDPERGSLRAFLLADVHGRAVDAVRSEVARRRREEGLHHLSPHWRCRRGLPERHDGGRRSQRRLSRSSDWRRHTSWTKPNFFISAIAPSLYSGTSALTRNRFSSANAKRSNNRNAWVP